MSPLRAVLIGAGSRGAEAYAPCALADPQDLRLVAVADPGESRREHLARQHAISADGRHADWRDALVAPGPADAAIIATQDYLHFAPAMRALELGLHVLLEKPRAPTEDECRRLVERAEASGRVFLVCHELRWTAFYEAVAEIVRSGRLGRILLVYHAVNLAYWE